MVNDLPGCLWLRLWGSGDELQGRQRMPGQVTDCSITCLRVPGLGLSGGREGLQAQQMMLKQAAITQQQDWLVYSMSYKDISHFAPEDAGKSFKGTRGRKGCQRRQPLASNKINGLLLAWVSLAWPLRRRGRAPGAAEDARAGGDCPAKRQTPPPGNRKNFPPSDTPLRTGNQK